MTRSICILMGVILSSFSLLAQREGGQSLRGIVTDKSMNPIEYATVSILSPDDSLLLDGTVTDQWGQFKLNTKVSKGSLRVSHVGYQSFSVSCDWQKIASDTFRIQLEPLAVDLDEVVVKGNRIEWKYDRYVAHLSGTALPKAKSSLETLSLMPGIMELNGSLKINGKEVSEVYVDKRKIDNYEELKNLPGSFIERVEVLPEVRSRHDGTQTGGAIYITLKKASRGGGYGSLSSSVSFREEHSEEETLGIPFNYRVGKFNFYDNLYVSHYKFPYLTALSQQDDKTGSRSESWVNRQNRAKYIENVFSLVWEIREKQSLGLNVMLNGRKSGTSVESESEIWNEGNHSRLSGYGSEGEQERFRYSVGLDYDYAPKKGRIHDWRTSAEFLAQAASLEEQITDSISRRNTFDDRLRLFRLKSDLSLALGKRVDMNLGLDLYHNYSRDDNRYANQLQSGWQTDLEESGLFSYKGHGLGGYVDLVYSLDRLVLNATVRLQGDWLDNLYREERMRRDYLNLFPGLRISYALDKDKKNRLTLSYQKSMGKIPYQNMNPAIVRISDLYYTKGNPLLNPSTEQELSLRFEGLGHWIFTYAYAVESDRVFSLLYKDDSDPRISYMMPTNIGNLYSHSLYVGFNKRFSDWYLLNASLVGELDREIGPDFKSRTQRALFLCQNHVTIPGVCSANLFFMYERGYRTAETFYHGVYNMSLTLYKNLLKDKLSLRCQIYNLFYKNRVLTTSSGNGLLIEKNVTPYRGAFLSVAYNFSFGEKVRVKKVNTLQSVKDASLGK